MHRRWLALVVLVIGVLLLTACPRQQPRTPAEDLTPETTTVDVDTVDVDEAPSPPVDRDQRPAALLSEDLEEVNSYVRGQGLLGDVFFDFDRFELRSEARERLARNADWLKANPEFNLLIEGHCDERGTSQYNLALGERRANAAKSYLVSLGVSADRVRTVSYGKERPFCFESHEGCWQQNRRAHFVITGRQ